MIKHKKRQYADKIKEQMHSNNTKEVYRGIKSLLNTDSKRNVSIDRETGESLNVFYTRFEDNNLDNKREQCRIALTTLKAQYSGITPAVSEFDVEKELKNINVKKSKGPDGVLPIVLKNCRNSIKTPLTLLFNWVLRVSEYPSVWKIGEIVPVPKIPCPKTLNDYRPVTLTPVMAKVFERFVQKIISSQLHNKLDSMQFAYKSKNSTVDAIVTFLHSITKHLDECSTNYARCLFIDYKSAFNTIESHVLSDILIEKGVSPDTCLLILSFLDNRQQFVRTIGGPTNVRCTSTGSPQGCVLSSLLFTIYTDGLKSTAPNVRILKYADDTVVVGLIKGRLEHEDEQAYLDEVKKTVTWGEKHYLRINEGKTKEMIIDFRKSTKMSPVTVFINDCQIAQVSTYKYLGLHIDSKLNFRNHIIENNKKTNKRLYLVKKLKSCGTDLSLVQKWLFKRLWSQLFFIRPQHGFQWYLKKTDVNCFGHTEEPLIWVCVCTPVPTVL